MNKTLIVIAAAAALVACNKQEHTIVTGAKTSAEPVNTVGVVLPPSILASKTYRCKDNSPAYIDWLSDNMSANFRNHRKDLPTHLTAAAAGEPLTDEGYSLTGDVNATSITLMRPDKGSQTCHV